MKSILFFLGCLAISGNMFAQYVVPSGTTVTYTTSINWLGDIIIEPNATLIVDGCTFGMNTGAKILIEDTGRLIGTNGAVFESSSKGGTWFGIQIEGTTMANTLADQAIDFEETTVSDADYAFSTLALARERSIRCENSTFINNRQHINFYFGGGNESATGFSADFINCEFLGTTVNSWAIQIGNGRFFNFNNCTFDCGIGTTEVFHIDAIADSKWDGNLFEPNAKKHIYFHHGNSDRNKIINNTFNIVTTSSPVAGGYDFISIMAEDDYSNTLQRTEIVNNDFVSVDSPIENKACAIYTEVASLAKIDIISNRFSSIYAGVDINDTYSVKFGSKIRLNSFENYMNGVITRGGNQKLRISCNTFSAFEADAVAIWNETGTLLNLTGTGPMNQFFTSDTHLKSTGSTWSYSIASTNPNPPVNFSGAIITNSVVLAEVCVEAREGHGAEENKTAGWLDNQSMEVYPNPASGAFTVDLSGTEAELIQLSISDISGRIVYTRTVEKDDLRRVNIDLSGENTGMYFVSILSETFSQTKQIIIQ